MRRRKRGQESLDHLKGGWRTRGPGHPHGPGARGGGQARGGAHPYRQEDSGRAIGEELLMGARQRSEPKGCAGWNILSKENKGRGVGLPDGLLLEVHGQGAWSSGSPVLGIGSFVT